jgi:hypothetical protein
MNELSYLISLERYKERLEEVKEYNKMKNKYDKYLEK